MSISKIKQKLIQNSIKDSGWLEKAKWRQENEDWLDISFSIAIRVASTLSANKKTGTYPKSQVELAEAMGCTAQYVNKLLRGQENLQIETICKVQRILGIKLIEVPREEMKKSTPYELQETGFNQVIVGLWASQNLISYHNDNFEKANDCQEEYKLQVA